MTCSTSTTETSNRNNNFSFLFHSVFPFLCKSNLFVGNKQYSKNGKYNKEADNYVILKVLIMNNYWPKDDYISSALFHLCDKRQKALFSYILFHFF